MDIPPAGVRNVGVRTAGSADLCLPLPEHSRTVYCYQSHYGPVSCGGAETGDTGIQAVVGEGRGGCGGGVDGGSGGGTDRGLGGDGRDGYGYRQLIMWEYTVSNVILGMEPNAPLVYAPVLEIHQPIMSMLGGN